MAATLFAPLPTLFVAALGVVALAGCGVNVELGDDTSSRTETERIPVAGLTILEVETDNGEVVVGSAGSSGDEVVVEALIRESDRGDAEVTIETDGDRLVVRGACDDGWFDHCRIGFEITVPAGLDVVVRTDNGHIDVADVEGRVEVRTDNGHIDLAGIDGGVLARSDNGAIDGRDLGADEVSAHTDNGGVDLRFRTAPTDVDVITDNGSIEVVLPDDGEPYDVEADSDHGDVDVDVDVVSEGPRCVVVRTGNGSIDVSHPA